MQANRGTAQNYDTAYMADYNTIMTESGGNPTPEQQDRLNRGYGVMVNPNDSNDVLWYPLVINTELTIVEPAEYEALREAWSSQ